jgi:hypothetical protein
VAVKSLVVDRCHFVAKEPAATVELHRRPAKIAGSSRRSTGMEKNEAHQLV